MPATSSSRMMFVRSSSKDTLIANSSQSPAARPDSTVGSAWPVFSKASTSSGRKARSQATFSSWLNMR